jgi:hypothetical protein
MEGLAHLVTESLARHNFEPTFDHRRIAWSKWFRCESNFSVLLAPSQPGVFALGEEIIAPGELSATGGKRMLALFQISEADDLGMALGHLFLPGSPVRDRFANGRCFARYAVIEDAHQRHAAYAALEQWAGSSSDTASGISNHVNLQSAPFSGGISQHLESQDAEPKAHIEPPTPLPSGF